MLQNTFQCNSLTFFCDYTCENILKSYILVLFQFILKLSPQTCKQACCQHAQNDLSWFSAEGGKGSASRPAECVQLLVPFTGSYPLTFQDCTGRQLQSKPSLLAFPALITFPPVLSLWQFSHSTQPFCLNLSNILLLISTFVVLNSVISLLLTNWKECFLFKWLQGGRKCDLVIRQNWLMLWIMDLDSA